MNLPAITLDLDGMRNCLLRRGTPSRVFFFEHSESDRIKQALLDRYDLRTRQPTATLQEKAWLDEIAVQRFLGHELFRVTPPGGRTTAHMPPSTGWENEHGGPIQSRADFDAYPWPSAAEVDLRQLDFYEQHLPPDMGIFVAVHIWEDIRTLFGYESFCYKLYEDPELVDAVAGRVGRFYVELVRSLCQSRTLFAVYGCDDFGYKTGLMMQPDILREKILVWHRHMARIAHEHGKLYFLHACGNLDEIMDHLIDDVRIDAKHSFEDVILPVTEAKRRYGHRVALLGGLDVDLIARADESVIRRTVRDVLDVCHPGGGYCLGLGNWVTEYIPIEHYLAVLDEGRRYTPSTQPMEPAVPAGPNGEGNNQ